LRETARSRDDRVGEIMLQISVRVLRCLAEVLRGALVMPCHST
jgi:hypothetical protein